MSEQDVLKIRDNLKQRRLTVEELSKIPLDIGLMNEEGFPHEGFLNYVSPEIDANDRHDPGARPVQQSQRDLLPGFFARIQVAARQSAPRPRCWCPTASSPRTRPGKYLLIVNKDNVVEQRGSPRRAARPARSASS